MDIACILKEIYSEGKAASEKSSATAQAVEAMWRCIRETSNILAPALCSIGVTFREPLDTVDDVTYSLRIEHPDGKPNAWGIGLYEKTPGSRPTPSHFPPMHVLALAVERLPGFLAGYLKAVRVTNEYMVQAGPRVAAIQREILTNSEVLKELAGL